jgi:hypothetical protein
MRARTGTKQKAGRKIDLYREHAADYKTGKGPALVKMERAAYLMIDGQGEPGGEGFRAQVSALYSVAYTIKTAKKSAARDYKVCNLEGLWEYGTSRAQMRWRLLIRTPEFVTKRDLAQAKIALQAKGKGDLVDKVMLETITEGLCVQALHVGPYATEPETVARMASFAEEKGYRFGGLHHEIYLSDPQRSAAERLRTILRYPLKRAA